MDQMRFNAVTKALTTIPSRRHVLRGLVGAGLGLGVLRLSDDVAAKKKKSKKKKGKKKPKKSSPPPPPSLPLPEPPLVFNEYGCVEVGQPCRGDSNNCCSGICEGPAPAEGQPDSSRCAAHGTGTCQQERPGICLSDSTENLSCNNDGKCRCFSTTAGSNVCAYFELRSCAACERDADCIAAGLPAGSACTPFSQGFCGGNCASGMACVIPCGIELPPPPPDM